MKVASCQKDSGNIWMSRSVRGSSSHRSLVKMISWSRSQALSNPTMARTPTATPTAAPTPTAASVAFARSRPERSPDHSTAPAT